MVGRATSSNLLFPPLAGAKATPLFRQVYAGLRRAILNGQLPSGGALPSTRTLARELGVSRNTIVSAYEQLLLEGYLEGRVGAGTYVTHSLPMDGLPPAKAKRVSTARPRPLSRRAGVMAQWRCCQSLALPLRPCGPAIDLFPIELWNKLAQRRWRLAAREHLGYGDAAGYRPLREAIAAHVAHARGVRCTADQVIIVSGANQALELVGRLLLDPGDEAWIEEPGYLGAKAALAGIGAALVPVPVDESGIDVAAGVAAAPAARFCYVTPSHQFPLGVTLSLPRRLALLEWARQARAWIVEDDYDSEFRFEGRPIAALQGLDADDRVLYLGSFSKSIFPALRLGYLIVPPDLVEPFSSVRAALDQYASQWLQAVAADFLVEGHFVRHLRRMRAAYAERQAALVHAAHQDLGPRLAVPSCSTGLHLVGWLPTHCDDKEVSRRAARQGVEAPALSAYRLKPSGRPGLMLGFAAYSPRIIRSAVRRLAAAL